ncbi:MAG: potassium channel family protein, partial [Pseudomonadota bacterium]
VGSVGAIYRLFPGSRFFAISLANFVAVYSCAYIFFIETNFQTATWWVAYALYGLPVLTFVLGAWRSREKIRMIVAAHRFRDERHLGHIFLWLLPMAVIGASTFAVPELPLSVHEENLALIVAMSAIAVIVSIVAANVASFLIDTGLLFEAFFERVARFMVPAFAFFTFYTLTIIIFATIYRIADLLTDNVDFVIAGEGRAITFTEALYFSIVTLSTVGYGDIVPASNLVRVIVSFQMIGGVMLLLFGFNELMSYAREHEKRDRK